MNKEVEEALISLICLISMESLDETQITLECGHSFNFDPLFQDIKEHKLTLNKMENYNDILGPEWIRCPYCKKKIKGLLPLRKGYPIIKGVNSLKSNKQ